MILDCHEVAYCCCNNELKTKHPTKEIEIEMKQLQPDGYQKLERLQKVGKDCPGAFERSLAPHTLLLDLKSPFCEG